MEYDSFSSAFPLELFESKRILIDEQLPQSCDFFLVGLIKSLSLSIFLYDCDSESFAKLLSSFDVLADVKSIYTSDEQPADIIDGICTRLVLNSGNQTDIPGRIHVYRSGTANLQNYYEYDLIIRIDGLDSGFTNTLDGTVSIFNRNITYKKIKYKITESGVKYYE